MVAHSWALACVAYITVVSVLARLAAEAAAVLSETSPLSDRGGAALGIGGKPGGVG